MMADQHPQTTFSIVPIEVCQDKRLTLKKFRVLVTLFSFRSKNTDTVWPSRQAIADRCHMPLSSISTATSALAEDGWLKKEGKGGYSKSTRYTITVPETVVETVTVAESATVIDPATSTVAKSVTRMPVAESVRGKEHNQEQTSEHNQRAKSKFTLPDWVPEDAWNAFIEMRVKIRKAPTEHAKGLLTQKLEKLRAVGEDVAAVLDQSTGNSWSGLFPVKQSAASSGKRTPPSENFTSRDYGTGGKL